MFKLMLLEIILFNLIYCQSINKNNLTFINPTPIVLWHGLGDSCCGTNTLGRIKKVLEKYIPGVYVKSIKIGNQVELDVLSSILSNANEQVTQVCNEIKNDVFLKDGYNAIGFSQGSQFLRAVAQRCPSPKIKNLISIGGQHQGVYGLPYCPNILHFCNSLRHWMHYVIYDSIIQNIVTPADYWHDPLNENEYKRKNVFLADINNELHINETYRENLKKLDNFVLVKFNNDHVVTPRITQWFGFYKTGSNSVTETLQESILYTEDRLGLKVMNESGKLHFISIDSDHLQFSIPWFASNIIYKFLI